MKFMENVVLIWRNTTNITPAVTQRLPVILRAVSCICRNCTKVGILI